MVRKMIFVPVFILTTIFLWPHQIACGNITQSLMVDRAKFDKFIKIFLQDMLEYGIFSNSIKEDMAEVIETLQAAIPTNTGHQTVAKQKIMAAAVTSAIAELIVEDANTEITIDKKSEALQSALKKTYKTMGVPTDTSFIQEIENLVKVFQKEKEDEEVETRKNLGLAADVNADFGLDVQLGTGINAGQALDSNLGLFKGTELKKDADKKLNSGKGFDINLILSFKFRLFSQLKAVGIMDKINYNYIKNANLHTLAQLMIKNLGSAFQFQIEEVDIHKLYNKLAEINKYFGAQQYYDVLADYAANLLAKNSVLADSDITVSTSLQAILTAISEAFKFNIHIGKNQALLGLDLKTGLNVRDDLNLGVNAGINLGQKTEVEANAALDNDAGLNLGLQTDVDVNANVDVIANLRSTLYVGLKSAAVLNVNAGKTFTKKQFYYLSSLIVKKLNTAFGLQLSSSDIYSLYLALTGVNIAVDINAWYAVMADYMSQILIQKGIITSDNYDEILQQCYTLIFSSISTGLDINIDINAALNLALGIGVGVGLDLKNWLSAKENLNLDVDAGLNLGLQTDVEPNAALDVDAGLNLGLQTDVKANTDANIGIGDNLSLNTEVDMNSSLKSKTDSGLEVDALLQFAADFVHTLASSDEFDSALLSGDKISVVLVITSMLESMLGNYTENVFISNFNM